MTRRIVSSPNTVGGAPTLEGTRLTCADVARNLDGLGSQRFQETYPHVPAEDISESLRYCAEQRCLGHVNSYCPSCRLRPDEPEGGSVWLLSARLLRGLHR